MIQHGERDQKSVQLIYAWDTVYYWWLGSEVDTLDTSTLREMSFGSFSDRTQDLPVFHRAVYDHSNALKVARNIPTYEGSDFPKSVREDSVLPGFEPSVVWVTI